MKKSTLSRCLAIAAIIIMSSFAASAKALVPFYKIDNTSWEGKYYCAPIGESEAPDDWYTEDFDDSTWGNITGPLYLSDGTWQANYYSYWVRCYFSIDELTSTKTYTFYACHDDGCRAYINGVEIYNNDGVEAECSAIVLSEEAIAALKTGTNVLCVFVSDSGGGDAYMDFGLYENDLQDMITESDVPVTITNDPTYPWVADGATAVIRGNNQSDYYAASWLTMNYSSSKSTLLSFEWASYDYCYHDGLQLYVDGVYFDNVYNNSNYTEKIFYLEAGDHTVAFRDSANYYNYARNWSGIRNVSVKEIAPLVIQVSIPGTLGDCILDKVEYFTDVLSLKLQGKLNDDDLNTLKNRLTNIYNLDLSEVDLENIPDNMFENHTILSCIKLPNNVVSIGNRAFLGCQRLQQVSFPSTLQSIGSYAFYGTYNIGKVVLPEGLTTLGENAFQYSRLTSVTFPSTLKVIRNYCFFDCDYLREVIFNGQTTIEYEAFYSCEALTTLQFPKTMNKICNAAFAYNKSLTNIEFNEGLYQIEDNAFYDCDALTEVTLPSSLVRADASPFDYCDNLMKVTCLSIQPPYMTDQIPYGLSMEGRELYVPALSLNVYKQTTGWDKFPTIKPIDSYPENIVITSDYKLNWPDSLNVDYKPNVSLEDRDNNQFGSLTVTGKSTLSACNFYMEYEPDVTYYHYYFDSNYESYFYNRFSYCSLVNEGSIRADNVTVGISLRENQWEFLTIPFDVKVSEIGVDMINKDAPFVIRKYDGQKRAEGLTSETWITMTADSTLHAGQGYIWRSSENLEYRNNWFYVYALQTTNKNNIFINDDVEVSLNSFESEFEHNRSWNLIGNPYPCFYDTRAMLTSAPITVWDTYSQNYRAYSPQDDNYILNPGQAFFVQRPVDEESITFMKEGRQTNLTVRDIEYDYNKVSARASSEVERSVFNVVLSNGEQNDRTRFVINGSAKMDYESARDASKFMALEHPVMQLYTMADEVRYSINERPLGEGVITLGMQIVDEGMYTISLDTKVENEIYLIDHLTGSEVRLDGNSYSFHSGVGTFDTRFSIRLGSGDTTGIRVVENAAATNAVYYDLNGRRISEPTKGVYVKDGKKVVVK